MESDGKEQKIYEFADFRLIPGEGLLLHNGEPVALQPKTFAVLALLVEHHGHLVEKSEILDLVWADSFVEEGSLSKSIWFVRQALGDTSKERFIQTIPRRGYRFVAPVSVLNESTPFSAERKLISTGYRLPVRNSENGAVEEPASQRESDSPTPYDTLPGPDIWAIPSVRGGMFGRIVLFFAVITLLGVALATYVYYPWKPSSGVRSIAILPFRPISPATRDELYEIGIPDELINRLSASEGLMIRSLTSVRRYTDLELDARAIGLEQRVDYVLAAHYQLADGKIRITGQLIDVATGQIEERYSFEKEAADVFQAQSTVAAEFKVRLASRFGIEGMSPPLRSGTTNEEAYKLYLLAMNFGQQRLTQDMQKAAQLFEEAVALDPNYARAWAAKAVNHRYLASYPGANVHEQYRRSMEAVEKALAIDPNLAEAHSALCHNKNRYEYDATGAENACRRAVDLDPNSADVQKMYANFLYSRGRFGEAIDAAKKAIDLQPLDYDNHQTLGFALYFSQLHEEEEAQWRRLIELNPNHALLYDRIARALELQGKNREALDYVIRKLRLVKADETSVQNLETAYSTLGWRGVTLERIKLVKGGASAGPFQIACLYASIGERDKAFEYLEKAYSERSPMIAVIQVEPQLASLRDDYRYAALIKKVAQGVNDHH